MKQPITAVDHVAGLALRLIAAVNLIFVLAFAASLLVATQQASGKDAISCTGQNLLAKMAQERPELLAGIRAEARTVENGDAMLWRVEKDGAVASYLFGTMHMADPRVVTLPAGAQAAFDGANTIVIETTEVLDPAKAMAAMLAHPDLMMFTDETTLTSLIPEEDRAAVKAALSARGIPLASIDKMKPWMVAALVALPACELKRKAAGEPVLDMKLARDAEARGKALDGLETIADQLGAMAAIPMEFHIQGLVDTLALGDMMDDVIETMIVLYLDGEPGAFWPFFRAALPLEGDADAGFTAFEELMITARNRTMVDRSRKFLDAGGAFVAVGALHLPGPDGLVALLRQAGYKVTAVR